jgi:hypothetical protein
LNNEEDDDRNEKEKDERFTDGEVDDRPILWLRKNTWKNT